MRLKICAILALPAMLAACGGNSVRNTAPPPPRPVTASVPATTPQAPATLPRNAQMLRIAGLESVIGSGADNLLRQFGQPRLDIREGDVRKLQFSGAPCVLDIYLYPVDGSPQPLATYLDARRASDGQEVDRVSCVDALRKSR